MAQKYNAHFFEISALTGMGIQNIFENIASEIYNYKSEIKNQQLEIDVQASSNVKQSKTKKKLVISPGSERYERRLDEYGSCVCWTIDFCIIYYCLNYNIELFFNFMLLIIY